MVSNTEKELQLIFKNGKRRLGSCKLADKINLESAIKLGEWRSALDFCMTREDKSALVLFLSAYGITVAWSWVRIEDVNDNVLFLQFPQTKKKDFDTDLMMNVKKEIEANLDEVDSVIDDITNNEGERFKSKAREMLEKITLDSVQV